ILMDCDQHGHAAALHVRRPHGVSRRLGRDHHHVEIGARYDLAEVDIEAVGKSQRRAFLHVRLDVAAIDVGDMLIGQQDHHEIRGLDRVGDVLHIQPRLLGLVPRSPTLAQADGDFHARILQVQRMGMALRAVTENGDFFSLDQTQVRVLVIKDFHVRLCLKILLGEERLRRPRGQELLCPSLLRRGNHETFRMRSPRPIPEAPVRTVSRIAPCSSASRKASSLLPVPVSSMVYALSVTSTMRPRKISAMRFISSRSLPEARTLTSISSRSIWSPSDRSTTLTTSMSLLSCLVICSMTSSEPEVTTVMRDSDGSSVGATVRDSML